MVEATVAALAAQAAQALRGHSTTPQLDAEVLLMHVLGVNRAYLFTHAQQFVAAEFAQQFQALLFERLQGKPVAYLTGRKEFWSLELTVSPDVLIPRPETELLVELALQLLPAAEPIQIADLGTGSGAIALALAVERPQWHIWATDLSSAALAVARANAERLEVRNITFAEGSWCQALPHTKFTAIISNPPYIDVDDKHLTALAHEPLSALAAADQGLADLAAIIADAKHYLLPQGFLLLEHGYNQGYSVAKKLYNQNYSDVKISHDLAGRERVTVARTPSF